MHYLPELPLQCPGSCSLTPPAALSRCPVDGGPPSQAAPAAEVPANRKCSYQSMTLTQVFAHYLAEKGSPDFSQYTSAYPGRHELEPAALQCPADRFLCMAHTLSVNAKLDSRYWKVALAAATSWFAGSSIRSPWICTVSLVDRAMLSRVSAYRHIYRKCVTSLTLQSACQAQISLQNATVDPHISDAIYKRNLFHLECQSLMCAVACESICSSYAP